MADQIVDAADLSKTSEPLYLLDPAVGDGELLLSLLRSLGTRSKADVIVFGFETDESALSVARRRIAATFPHTDLRFEHNSFLNFVAADVSDDSMPPLFVRNDVQRFDLIIANPPYVRTQIIGAEIARELAASFSLTGRVDLYHAFLVGIGQVLKPSGTAGVIVSNRFMTTRGGASVRASLRSRFTLRHIWDLGDTKLFDAAVLPAVILANGRNGRASVPTAFTSIYQTNAAATALATDPIAALSNSGIVELDDRRRFHIRSGTLDDQGAFNGIWRIATASGDAWLATVVSQSWGKFSDIGKIRVGVKTCADKVFIRNDWNQLSDVPELLRPLTTHHVARRFRAIESNEPSAILYPHTIVQGQRQSVDLSLYPKARAYLQEHRQVLENRTYVTEAGRKWYELWVPQNPDAWSAPKLVFRDISERPTFWLDLDGTVVNGDCYWLSAERPENEPLLWLAAAVANSTFTESFYDHRFNNKLYSGRRRFITQYVEQFPLPDPSTELSHDIVSISRQIYSSVGSSSAESLESQLDEMVWQSFGLVKESSR